ncbi:UNVERIFIED_CONTAM: hypothetical protein Slati_1701700 [Sesamum latifolium]|uniref:Transposase-associated domain-containing protein n=1 Tax=Sesamum latifolium TaxID=2727402 RepID=A0AAW2WW54_9LAMI
MYEKNLPNRAGLTPEFQDGVTAFIEWAKSQQAYMDGVKIRFSCRKCKNEVFKISGEVNFDLYMKSFMPEYYNWTSHGERGCKSTLRPSRHPHLQNEQNPPAPAEEGTSTHWGDAAEMNWVQMMVFDAVGQAYNQDGEADDGTRSCSLDAALVHLSMAVAPIIMCMDWQIDFRIYCTLPSSPCGTVALHLNWLLWLSWWI